MLCLGMIMYFLLAGGDLALFILLRLQFWISVDYGNYYESCMYIVDIMWAANSILHHYCTQYLLLQAVAECFIQ